MDVTRRDFIKISGASAAGLMLGSLFDLAPVKAHAWYNPAVWTNETTSICCYCAVGCGLIIATNGTTSTNNVVYVQGNPDHPINKGTLCSKGQAIGQLRTVDGALNPNRLTQPMVRRPNATSWTPISWNTALTEIADHIKTTRDANTTTEEMIDGSWTPVNRCEGIACLGGAAHDNEECYLLVKLTRALGLVYIEHQARI